VQLLRDHGVTLILRPKGRGNWATTTLVLQGAHALPLLIRAGQTFSLGGVNFRIVQVKP
jgi:hypothetical protein